MTGASNADIEAAEARVAAEVDATIAQVQRALQGAGSSLCRDCGAPIDPARREALPSAVSCIACATRADRGRR